MAHQVKLEKANIGTIRPWANQKLENTMVAVTIDGRVVGYVWKKERRFPVLAGMIKIGETSKKVYAAAALYNTNPIGHYRTRTAAIEALLQYEDPAASEYLNAEANQ